MPNPRSRLVEALILIGTSGSATNSNLAGRATVSAFPERGPCFRARLFGRGRICSALQFKGPPPTETPYETRPRDGRPQPEDETGRLRRRRKQPAQRGTPVRRHLPRRLADVTGTGPIWRGLQDSLSRSVWTQCVPWLPPSIEGNGYPRPDPIRIVAEPWVQQATTHRSRRCSMPF